jgi:uncharacterized protein
MRRCATPSNDPDTLTVTVPPGATTTALVYPADRDAIGATLMLAHGAGAGQRSPWLVQFARALAALGVDVVTFNFLYVEQRRRTPDRRPLLEACYRAAIESAQRRMRGATRSLFIGGKSMGGRIATQVAAADPTLAVSGLVLLGYPLHPPGKPAERRDKHLPAIARPMLFVQGTRDAFGTPAELSPILARLQPAPSLHTVAQGDHSFKLPRKDPAAQAAVYADVQRAIVEFIARVSGAKAFTPSAP